MEHLKTLVKLTFLCLKALVYIIVLIIILVETHYIYSVIQLQIII